MNPSQMRRELYKAGKELREASEAARVEFWKNMLDHWDEALETLERVRPSIEHARLLDAGRPILPLRRAGEERK